MASDQALVDADPGSATLVLVDDASHLGAVTGTAEPAVARLVADDLAWRLGGSGAEATGVADEENSGPLHVTATHGD